MNAAHVGDARAATDVAAGKLASFDRHVRSATLAACLIVVVGLAALGLYTIHAQANVNRDLLGISRDNQRSLAILQGEASPAVAAHTLRLIVCLELNSNRNTDLVLHLPAPPLPPDCPTP